MCKICNKSCYQFAYLNDSDDKGLCITSEEDCEKKIVIEDNVYCGCKCNPEINLKKL